MNVSIDPAELSARWTERWSECRPIGHELRSCAADRWVRFHSLPESKRYAESGLERAEILRRHNAMIDALVSGATGAETALVVVTCAWSNASEPKPLGEAERSASPHATYWRSILREEDNGDGDAAWNHLYVDMVAWRSGVLDELLLLVANDVTADAFVAPTDFEWLYHPYDGGADVIAASPARRDELRALYGDWLPVHSSGL